MSLPWLWIWELGLTIAVVWSTAFTILIITLPTRYQHSTRSDEHQPTETEHEASKIPIPPPRKTSVQAVVLGDIGRSPRMQYHALSIAQHGGQVSLVGYTDSMVHPDITASAGIDVVSLVPFPKRLQTNSKVLFIFLAPFKVLWQIWSLYYALAYVTGPSQWMLVQNPPSVPTLLVARIVCLIRGTRLVIDWHNFGYSILALRLGARHPLVRFSEWYEGYFGRGAAAHICVSRAMSRVLTNKWTISAVPLHDRPPLFFQPLSSSQRSDVVRRLPDTSAYAEEILDGSRRLLVSSTSWTPDEDFSILLDGLTRYSTAVRASNGGLPNVLVIITGKGPQREHYLKKIEQLKLQNKLSGVPITTAWLSIQDYASLLGAADLGISLHTSSSGVDLPMKVVDMFGAGLPVAGWNKFEAWNELVHEGENGRGFASAKSLCHIFQDLFSNDGAQLATLRHGALKECRIRWDDQWMLVAGRLFQLGNGS